MSIALAETLVPERANTPWLGRAGLAVTVGLFLLGAAASTAITLKFDPFVASKTQFAIAAILCAMLVVASFRLPRRSTLPAAGSAPSPWLPAIAALVAGSIFLLVPREWAWVTVSIYAVLYFSTIVLIRRWSHSAGWSQLHRLALAGGAASAYGWHAFIQTPAVGQGGTVDRVGNAIFAAALIAVLIIAARRNAPRSPVRSAGGI